MNDQKDITVMLQFIRQQLTQGASEADVREALKKEGGWNDTDLDAAFSSLRSGSPSGQAITKSPTQPTQQVSAPQTETPPSTSHKYKWLRPVVGVIIILTLLTAGGVAAYTYIKKTGMFSDAPYTEDNLLSGLVSKIAEVKTVTYGLSGSLEMQPRDDDAFPFVLEESGDTAKKLAAYKRDLERSNNVRDILWELRDYGFADEPYPASFTLVYQDMISEDEDDGYNYYSSSDSEDPGHDPKTGAFYEYSVTDNGNDFALVVTFETAEAMSSIYRMSWYRNDKLLDQENDEINTPDLEGIDKTVTFTKESNPPYLYNELPKPFLVEWGEQARMLPPEMSASGSIKGTTDIRSAGDTDWEFSIDGMADFGDMAYKVAFDVRKIEGDYYFQIRNMPGLFISMFGVSKNTWVKISPDEYVDSGNSYSYLGELAEELPEIEDEYKEGREEFVAFMEDLIAIVEEEKLILFREQPFLEKIDGRSLYKYDLRINKDAIVPFMERVIAKEGENNSAPRGTIFYDTTLLDYLKSDEFNQMFDYLDKNVSFVVHVDPDGYPARIENGLRLVPPDTAIQLKDKQGYVTFTISLDNINKKVDIEVPDDARPVKEVIEEAERNMEYEMMSSILPNIGSLTASGFNAYISLFKKQ